MKAANYLKTELEIINVNELDGELPVVPQERNFLREKTFNNELNQLVNKIFNNEKMSNGTDNDFDDIIPIEKNSVLLKCEELIYKIKHMDELNLISSSYNPFEIDIDVYDDIDDIADYIKAGLLQSGYQKYQILKYNFNDKAFRSNINHLDPAYSSDMYFSINDPVVTTINENDPGFVITRDLIESDIFFSKKFSNEDSEVSKKREFYIIKIYSLFKDSINNISFLNRTSRFEEYLSPLLLVELNKNDMLQSQDLYNSLCKSAGLPLMLYFLKNRIKFNITNYSYEDTLLMIELFIKSSIDSKLTSHIITLNDYSIKNNIFLLKFALSKIKRLLKKNSLLLRISVNRAILITTSREVCDISSIIDRVNSGEEIITMQQIDYRAYLYSKEFVNLFL